VDELDRIGPSGALQVVEGRGQAERLVQDQRAAVHGPDHIPADDGKVTLRVAGQRRRQVL
jgi:hypothetical protein